MARAKLFFTALGLLTAGALSSTVIAQAPRKPTSRRSMRSQSAAIWTKPETGAPGGRRAASGADIAHDELHEIGRHMRVGGCLVLLGQHLFAHRRELLVRNDEQLGGFLLVRIPVHQPF